MSATGASPAPVLALTMGDPAGIGPEITRKAWTMLRRDGPVFALFGDPDAVDAPVRCITDPRDAARHFADAIPVVDVPLACPARPGKPDVTNAASVIESIARATRAALGGEADAVVTNPISKIVLARAGFPHPGHTEFLAELTGSAGREVMMLASPMLRVVPVTIHLALRAAIAALDTAVIVRAARTTDEALRTRFGIASPRLAIAGLNPHAGEEGRMGDEEGTIIRPAIAILRADGLDVRGPMPPDTMFAAPVRATYDAAICMYHDQALIPLKTLDMAGGVNVTLGLPIVRTSPDHGTAFDIAGRERADPSSLVAALRLACDLSERERAEAIGGRSRR